MMKRIVCLVFVILLLVPVFSGCKKEEKPSQKLSFSDTNLNDLKKLDGEIVTINGYMSTLSPISGAFMYLLNLPYQSCPFCEPNTTTLSNTMAIYAEKGKKFEFTDRLIQVTGRLEFKKNGQFTDEYGYNYAFRIVDARYEEVNTAELGAHLQLWQSLASTEVVADVYSMYEYINFLCFWGTYTATFADGEKDYLYPDDLQYFLFKEGSAYHYGYKDGYFESLISRIEAVDKEAFSDLVANIEQAEAFAHEVLDAFEKKDYELVDEYSKNSSTGKPIFGNGRKQYRMKDADIYETRINELYRNFAQWLGEWEV